MRGRGQSAIGREVVVLQRTLRALDRSLGRIGPLLEAEVGDRGAATPVRVRRRPLLAPTQRAALKLQGRYMGYMRQLRPQYKAKVRKAREMKGVRVAIATARQLSLRQKAA